MNTINSTKILEDAIKILKNYKEKYIKCDELINSFNKLDHYLKITFNNAIKNTDDIEILQAFVNSIYIINGLKYDTDNKELRKSLRSYIDKIEYDKSIFPSNPVKSDKSWGLYDVDDTYILKFYSAEERDERMMIYTTNVYADMITVYDGEVKRGEVKFKTYGDLKDALDYKYFIQ